MPARATVGVMASLGLAHKAGIKARPVSLNQGPPMYINYSTQSYIGGLECVDCCITMLGIHSYAVREICSDCGGFALNIELEAA